MKKYGLTLIIIIYGLLVSETHYKWIHFHFSRSRHRKRLFLLLVLLQPRQLYIILSFSNKYVWQAYRDGVCSLKVACFIITSYLLLPLTVIATSRYSYFLVRSRVPLFSDLAERFNTTFWPIFLSGSSPVFFPVYRTLFKGKLLQYHMSRILIFHSEILYYTYI